MRTRLLSAAAVLSAVALALPAHAATAAKPQISDPTGDANGANNQGFLTSPNASVATGPAEDSAGDIVSATFASTFKKVGKRKVTTGFTVAMKLAAAPTLPDHFYRVLATTGSCTSLFLEYASGGGTAVRCANSITSSDVFKTPKVKVRGTTITWTVPTSALPAGTVMTALHAETRLEEDLPAGPIGGLVIPTIDQADTTKTFTVGK